MTTDPSTTRRRVLGLTGVAASSAFLAGCGGPGGDNESDGETEAEEGTGNGQDIEEDEEPSTDDGPNETAGNETENATNETGGDNESENTTTESE
ncbi:hypothetical protein ACERIM_04005 [Natrinema sp. H-ect1]|uniref:hypothetical protein n=1 Tax=Natrinema sp. H-ect1 TaxID=3242700 RepID=UPI00359DA229